MFIYIYYVYIYIYILYIYKMQKPLSSISFKRIYREFLWLKQLILCYWVSGKHFISAPRKICFK